MGDYDVLLVLTFLSICELINKRFFYTYVLQKTFDTNPTLSVLS